jgi:hypothetical protein
MKHLSSLNPSWTLALLCAVSLGCTQPKSTENTAETGEPTTPAQISSESPIASSDEISAAPASTSPVAPLGVLEIKAEDLLKAQLAPELLSEGWVRLFDGQSLQGWFISGQANWSIADGILQVDQGEKSFLCTNFQIPDYELQVEFRCDAQTNSGIFLRTTPQPQPDDVAIDCLELNIAPPDNPFPTGSFVQRKKLEPSELGSFDPTAWHTFHVRLSGNQVTVKLDDREVMHMEDIQSSPTGYISLQHNEGHVEFRNILMRPVDSTALKLGENWQDDWTASEKEAGTFQTIATSDGMQLKGGLGQLQSKQEYGDFILQAKYTLAAPEVNSGIFFRCITDAILDGYECQVNHATINGDPLMPADAGAGAIFRRQPARIVVGDGTTPTYLTLLANGPQMVTWVNGIPVVDFVDQREPDENPRRGLRITPGPIALQGHDATTEVTFHELSITNL